MRVHRALLARPEEICTKHTGVELCFQLKANYVIMTFCSRMCGESIQEQSSATDLKKICKLNGNICCLLIAAC